MSATPPGWPFFAPSPVEHVEAALALAAVGADDHVVDLGCGDGQVLLAAARRGARVTGVECDAELAAAARRALAEAGVRDGVVVEADLFAPDLLAAFDPPDVVFCYLSPATLQRLTPRLRELPDGTRLVTVDFPVPDLVPEATSDGACLYVAPLRQRRARPSQTGWANPGTLCVMPPSVISLTCLEVRHPGGDVSLSLSGGLTRCASAAVGLSRAGRGQKVAVDIRWQAWAPGTLGHGYVQLDGLDPHLVVVLFSSGDQGQWDLSDLGCTALLSRLRTRSLPPPRTVDDLLGALT